MSILSAANITERPQPLIVSKSNINVLLAHKWCLLSFCFIFHSKDLNRQEHSVSVGAEGHPEKPQASKIPQNNTVPTGFSTFWSGCSLEFHSHFYVKSAEFITLACNFSLR